MNGTIRPQKTASVRTTAPALTCNRDRRRLDSYRLLNHQLFLSVTVNQQARMFGPAASLTDRSANWSICQYNVWWVAEQEPGSQFASSGRVPTAQLPSKHHRLRSGLARRRRRRRYDRAISRRYPHPPQGLVSTSSRGIRTRSTAWQPTRTFHSIEH